MINYLNLLEPRRISHAISETLQPRLYSALYALPFGYQCCHLTYSHWKPMGMQPYCSEIRCFWGPMILILNTSLPHAAEIFIIGALRRKVPLR